MQSRRPYPEFTKVQEIGNVAEAKYNSLAVKLTRRLDKGLSVLGGYTFSKSTDNGSGIRTLNGDTLFPQDSDCLECEWGLSIFDVRHRFVSSILYELPFGDGKPFLQTASAARSSAGGRSARSSASRAASRGTPLAGTDRPNTGSDQRVRTSCPARIPNDGPKTIAAVVQHRCVRAASRWAPAATPAATSSSGPGIINFDMSIIRNFRFGGSKSLQFRLEAFNAFNHPVWNDPNTSMANRAVRHHHQHEKADARAAARREVRVLDTAADVSTRDGARRIFRKEGPPCPFFMKLYNELASWWQLMSPAAEYAEEAAFYRTTLHNAARHRLRPFSNSAAAVATTHRT